MAKGKSLNPADSQRKAERKKELKKDSGTVNKNKADRQKTRDFALVKKDTSSLEEDIERLEKAETDHTITAPQRSQLSTLRAELTRIQKKKEEYVAEHPEHRKLVFRARHKKTDQETEGGEGGRKKTERKVFDKHGIPRHPERSVYYDPVMNPFGVPPPGMPYMERPLRPDEVDSQAEDDSDEEEDGSDDDVAMPLGPPPSAKKDEGGTDDQDSDDDIPMPEGPPPSSVPSLPPLPPLPTANPISLPPHALSPFPPNFLPPPPSGFPAAPPMGFSPPPPNTFPHYSLPPPPPGFTPLHPPSGFTPHPLGQGHLPRRVQSNSSMQDPLAYAPHQTFQAYRANQALAPLPSVPAQGIPGEKPSPPIRSQPATFTPDAGTVSAPAQLRDLKKESTAFLPSSLKRKKPGGVAGSSGGPSTSRVDAAPGADLHGKGINDGQKTEPARPDLLGALKSNFPAPAPKSKSDNESVKKRKLGLPESKKGKDDYEKFMDEIGDILAP